MVLLQKNKRRKKYPMSEDIKNKIFELTKEGILIDTFISVCAIKNK